MSFLSNPNVFMGWNGFSTLYDEFYARGEEIFAKHNLCDVKDGKCKSYRLNEARGNFCCRNCPHLGPEGCTVKALYCKLWICSELIDTLSDEVLQELGDLFEEAEQLNMLRFRASKEQTFRKGNSNKNMWNRYLSILYRRRRSRESSLPHSGSSRPSIAVTSCARSG